MTMPMVNHLVAEAVLSPYGRRDAVIDLEQVSISQVQSTSGTLPLLPCEKDCLFACHQRVILESLCPIDEVSVKDTRLGADFDVSLDFRRTVPVELHEVVLPFWVFERYCKGSMVLHPVPVFLVSPLTALLRVSVPTPTSQLKKQDFVALAEGGRCDTRLVVV